VLDLLRSLESEFDMGILIVTHNFGVVADLCDRVSVMRAGRIVETGPARSIFGGPRHEYTKALFEAILEDSKPRAALAGAPHYSTADEAEETELAARQGAPTMRSSRRTSEFHREQGSEVASQVGTHVDRVRVQQPLHLQSVHQSDQRPSCGGAVHMRLEQAARLGMLECLPGSFDDALVTADEVLVDRMVL